MADPQSDYSEAAARAFAEGVLPPERNPMEVLGAELMGEFTRAEALRQDVEDRWLMDLRQFRGLYEPDEEAKMQGSKAFLRKTRVKVESVDARLMDLLFPANRERNYSITATPEPSVAAPLRQKVIDLLTAQANGQEPDKDTLKKAIKAVADKAAAKMETRIDDQLAECRYRRIARDAMHSGHLYGTGIIKGPLVERKTRISYVWDEKAGKGKGGFTQSAETFSAPMITHVPIWRWYPDMAVTDLADCRYTWEHHRLAKSDMVDLADRKTFNGTVIKGYLRNNPDGCIKVRNYEGELRQMNAQRILGTETNTGQYDVFERWGWLDADQLVCCGVQVPEDRMHEAFFANVWVLPTGEVIKAVLAPIEGMRWPYRLYYLDKDETSIFGDGLAAIMRGDQSMLNAAVRMLLDNTAITAGDMYEVDVRAFPPTSDITSIHPHKIFPRTGGDSQYPAVRTISGSNHAEKLLPLVQLFDQNADETTAIPKFTYGDNPTKGAAGTMGGLSMLLGQANISLKDFVISWDEGITKPLITDLYHWNMKFSSDDTIKGDYDVMASGAASLVAKEVRSQALAQFSAMLQPEERARVKWGELTVQKANSMDLADVVMTDEEWQAFQADPANQQQQQMQQMMQQLQTALLQGQVAEIQSKAAKIQAEALSKRVDSVFAAMQAGGAAAQNPHIAPAGDAILQSSGWKDADQQPGSGAALAESGPTNLPNGQGGNDMQPAQPMQASPHEGEREGIETTEMPL